MSSFATKRALAASTCAALLLTCSAALGGTAAAAPAGAPEPPKPAELTAVRVSLSAPVSVQRGDPVDLGAVVSAPTLGERAPGVVVILYSRPAKRGAWAEEDRAVTGPSGVATFRNTPRTTTDYAAESLPGQGFDGGLSGVVQVKVRR